MADRILVFRGGRIVAESGRASFDREAMLLAAAQAAREIKSADYTDYADEGEREEGTDEENRGRERGGANGWMSKLMRDRELGLVWWLLLIGLGIKLREPHFFEVESLEQAALPT